MEHTEKKDMPNCQQTFYESLYDKISCTRNNLLSDILGVNVDKLSDEENQNLEGNITYTELFHSLKQMKNEKSPGFDGHTAGFYNFF